MNAFKSVLVSITLAAGSLAVPAAWADLILYNGKVLTADAKFRVAEAIAIKDGKVVAVGNNREVLSHATAQTRRLDLKGRTVIPGIIDTHQHLDQEAIVHFGAPQTRISGATWPEIKANALAAATRQAAAGKWIFLAVPTSAKETPTSTSPTSAPVMFSRGLFSLADLDAVAPQHPLMIRGERSSILNTSAINLVRQEFGTLCIDKGDPTGCISATTGITQSVDVRRIVIGDLVITDPRKLANVFEMEMLESASYGVTTFSIFLLGKYAPAAFNLLVREGRMPLRFANKDSLLYSFGNFTDRLWNLGCGIPVADGGYPNAASTLPGGNKNGHILQPGSPGRTIVERCVRTGNRLYGFHVAGDVTLDVIMDIIEEQSKLAGMSIEEVRAQRHAIDHLTVNPRQDQIPRMKKLGLFMSAQPKYIESTAPLIETTVGSAFTNRVVPVKSLLDGGVRTVFGTDEHVPNVVFLNMGRLVTRKAKVGTTEKVLNPEERIDRMTALLMATRWAAEYVLRENVLGSLEPGKWADLVVIDRDFLSIPDDEIRNTKVLLTAVGGKIVHTEPAFAQAEGLPQIGHRPR